MPEGGTFFHKNEAEEKSTAQGKFFYYRLKLFIIYFYPSVNFP